MKPSMKPSAARSGKQPRLAPYWRADAGDYVTDLAWSPDGLLLAATAANGDVMALDGKTGDASFRRQAHGFGGMSVAWSPDGARLASGGQDGHVRFWAADGAPLTAVNGGAAWVEHLAWSPHGRWLASASGKIVRVWDAQGRLVHELPPHSQTVTGLRWAPASDEIATSAYGAVRVWKLGEAGPGRVFDYAGALVVMRWSADGRVIACGCQDGSVHIWMTSDGKDLEMSGYPTKVRAVTWDPSSRWLATGAAADVIVWDFSGAGPAGTRPVTLSRHRQPVVELAFRDDAVLASGGADGLIVCWAVRKTGGAVVGLAEESGGVSRLAWQPDGRSLAAGYQSGVIALWPSPKSASG